MIPIWGLNTEGEMKGLYTDTGVEDCWIMMGNLALCRFYSSTIALRECFFRFGSVRVFCSTGARVLGARRTWVLHNELVLNGL